MIKIIKTDGFSEKELISSMRQRVTETEKKISDVAVAALADIKNRGYEAVEEYSVKFDGCAPYEIDNASIKEAYDRTNKKVIEALTNAAENIRIYHEKMLQSSWTLDKGDGRVLGQRVRGLTRVGLYVPGGIAAYPSSVLMNAVPAKAAGVKELIMVTPPREFLNDTVLAAAYIAEIDRIIAIGGIQAIGALAYGAGFIPRVDKIVGPGNAYVAAAKRLVYGTVDIDIVAGPSEVLVIGDETTNPVYAAADLMSQAEHDVLASAVMVTTSMDSALKTAKEIRRQSEYLSRKDIIEASLRDFGAIVVCDTMDEAVKIANEIAPEHLELMCRNAERISEGIINAGAIFIGEYSPEPLGDYMAGPCHVLPTSGTARFFSPLSVDSFLKKTSVIYYEKDALLRECDDILTLARQEHLTAHANSIEVRMK
ncbi:MAG: histidinol dehydrogenase [Clostridiales bacterium]|nr:histidinol dehydrogenase [Clostridiales bacterium]